MRENVRLDEERISLAKTKYILQQSRLVSPTVYQPFYFFNEQGELNALSKMLKQYGAYNIVKD